MRINPYSNQAAVEQITGGTNSAKSKTTTSSVNGTGEADAISRSNALSGLLSALRQLPDVRTESVAAAQSQIDSGELSTPGAAAETATVLDEASNG